MTKPRESSKSSKKVPGPSERLGKELGIRQTDLHGAATATPLEVVCMQNLIIGLEAEKARAEKFMGPTTTKLDCVTIFAMARRDILYLHSNFMLPDCSYPTKLATNQPRPLEDLVANLVATEDDFKDHYFRAMFPQYLARTFIFYVAEEILIDPRFRYLHFGDISKLFVVGADDAVTPYSQWREKRKQSSLQRNRHGGSNPWLAGTFYLIALLAVLVTFRLVFGAFNPLLVPVIIGGVLLAVSVIGAFTLKNQDLLKDKPFLELMALALKSIPGLIRHKTSEEDSQESVRQPPALG